MTWLWVALGVVVVAIVVVVWRVFSTNPRAVLAQLPAVPIAEAKDGAQIKLVGEVRVIDGGLTAPLSGRCCAAYLTRVEHDYRSAKGSMLTAATGRRRVAFLLDDGQHQAEVIPDDADLDLLEDFDHALLRGEVLFQKTPPPDDLEERAGAFLLDYDKTIEGIEAEHGANTFRCRESAVVDGQRVAVMGMVKRAEGGGGYRDGAKITVLALYVSNHEEALGPS